MNVSIWDKKEKVYLERVRNIEMIYQCVTGKFFDFKFTNGRTSKKYDIERYLLNFIHND